MNSVKNNRRVHNDDKPFPGCLGRMVNLFDLTPTTVNGNKLLTDKPHREHGYLSLSIYPLFCFILLMVIMFKLLVCGFVISSSLNGKCRYC
jgi:hypothetical protein